MPLLQIAERMYYDDRPPLEFTATVTEIRELERVEGKPVFQVALDRTAFYPTGGGQPHDTGVLVATARSGAVLEAAITAVSEDESGEVWHTTAKPLQPGTEIVGRVDAERRRDHMQQHSGQHLLSAIAWRDFGAATVGFHVGAQISTVDLTVAALSVEEMLRLQTLVNDAVMRALPVWQHTVSGDEAQRLLASGVLQKLPKREGPMRVVTIGEPGAELDQNACGGTHVTNTAAIGPVLLRRTERVRGNTRLSFVCGGRALRVASEEAALLQQVASTLSVGAAQVLDRVRAMQAEIAAARKLAKRASRE